MAPNTPDETTPPASISVTEAQDFVNKFNEDYAARHYDFETQFWGTKMALASTDKISYSGENLAKTKKHMEDLLSDPSVIQKAKDFKAALLKESKQDEKEEKAESDLLKVLNIIIRTCQCYDMPSPEARAIREETNQLESKLEEARNHLELGYYTADETNDKGEDGTDEKNEKDDKSDSKKKTFHPQSSVGLRNLIRIYKDESIRKAAYESLRSIGPFICENGFVEIVKLRNKLAKQLGYEDYYDYKVTNAEGFGKKRLFEILDGLQEGTRPLLTEARNELERRHGPTSLEPWNSSFCMSGSIIEKMDPYFSFSKSVERYIRSYAALGIKYAGATMTLDLLDRPQKYSNGFCHWPVAPWIKPDGTWVPSQANFTSLADPAATGSGLTALTTLMHEAGHAAHMANVKQASPLFSQERAPTSVAYAENQSMLLDSLVGDAAWRARYALHSAGTGKPIPFDIIEEEIRAKHPFEVFQLRAMLAVSYFEKALYEMPTDELSSERIQKLADEIETSIQGGPSPRPILSVPHIISDEASCYYQGYTLAEMSVHQTRAFFLEKYGSIVDNPNVGPTLTEAYWKCGNTECFLDLVKNLTSKDLTGDAWTAVLKESVNDKVAREKKEYEESLLVTKNKKKKRQEEENVKEENEEEIDLDMIVRFVDGDKVIADSSSLGLLGACKAFEKFVAARVASS